MRRFAKAVKAQLLSSRGNTHLVIIINQQQQQKAAVAVAAAVVEEDQGKDAVCGANRGGCRCRGPRRTDARRL